ncbi:MAG: PKD domain-containing protein [Acidobacteria bacterium]|nr:PKD domain-containing protein [Acidobacteriota bacterium]
MMKRLLPSLAFLLTASLAFAQTPKKVLFDHTGWEDGGTSAYWIIDTHEPDPSPANPAVETDWNGGISCLAFDLLKKGYTVQTLPASGGRITFHDSTNAQDLSNYAVYVIPECYRLFTAAEKQAIVAFVQAGGGLYMMGNHDGATRVTSSHPGSTDAFHVFNDLLANEASGFGFTYVDGHGPSDSNANTTTTAITAGTSPMEQAIVHGPNGLVTAMDFHSFAYINITGSNPATKWIVQTQVSGDPSTDYFMVATTYGAGRVVAIGDSSPSDDGTTTTSGKSLIDGYHSNSNKAEILNSVDWLAGASSSTSNTVTASITTPSGNVTLNSGASQSFSGSATDSSSSATLSYAWNFGDGSTATGASASHAFTNTGTSALTRTVTFTATDNTGASSSATRVVTVNPAASAGGTFAEVEPNNSISTANAVAASFNAITGHLTSSSDKDYFALALQPGQTLSIAMTGPSGKDWDLYLRNSAGSTLASSTGSTANENLSYTNAGATVMTVYPEVVVYSGTSSSPYTLALTYSGGGTTANTVTAAITTPASNVTIASGTAQAFAGTATDSASGQTISYAWSFGDGVSANGASVSHTYTNSGTSAVTYTATLTATDGTGATGTATRTITVNPAASSGGSALTETFDTGVKGSYSSANVTFASGTWTLSDALLGSSASDPHDGVQSVRVRNSGTVTMDFDFPTGAKTVTVKAGSYGSDAATTWGLWYSTNGGSTWTEAGGPVTTSSTTLTASTFTVNVTGAIRFQIRKTDGTTKRVNFDDFQISGY